MAIIHMCSKPEEAPAGVVLTDVSDSYRNSVSGMARDGETQEQADQRARANFKLYLYKTHVGLCIQDHERNGYDDSDFYMTVWNPETQQPEEILFASTRGWSYPCYGSSPDATPEVMAAYRAWEDEQRRLAAKRRKLWEDAQPTKGKLVKVVKGRKVPQGTTGRVCWMDSYPAPTRVGILTEDGQKHFTSAANVQVIDSTPVEMPKPVTTCNRCGCTSVAWVKSQRTGKPYMVNLVDGVANPRNFHSATCGK